MADYGVCSSLRDCCELSPENPRIDMLLRRIRTIEVLQSRNEDTGKLIPQLSQFAEFFQESASCIECNKPLSLVSQPTAEHEPGSPERRRRERLNEVLDCIQTLKDLGTLTP